MVKRLLPLGLIAAVAVLFMFFDMDRFISIEALREHRSQLLDWVAEHDLAAPIAYMAVYVAIVAFSLPAGTAMTVAGGFLFGAFAGGVYTVVGATIGAVALFLIAKTSLGDYLLARAGNGVKKMQAGFAENAWSYMFVLRLVPIFPFFLVNLVPAFLGVPLRIYVVATFLGIMPATFVFALAGSGLGSVLDQGGEVSIQGVMTLEVVAALFGLALLSMIPVIYKHIRKPANGEIK
ncbi:putative membrane protein YdjX, TVP38/TMEM64 family, SNARE-associated domain [Mariprofundus ferrinatatus]|uniref:TVP38/TMEM64 family membrane protein n=1 Tax=Mariprofundus ferrinatatus TaxID=1921087 RepID=A0A2K8L2N0_9PROT|nr:TVP38/TMEM64 family protein [Mariprofundus ferrinatatus]ATX81590.1 putative membrane protein YdjX, TVP38/TMEM64 family, SNARE-associated domain [Mariprofundus ferrinatatus]